MPSEPKKRDSLFDKYPMYPPEYRPYMPENEIPHHDNMSSVATRVLLYIMAAGATLGLIALSICC